MLQFKNKTPFPGTLYVTPDEHGIDTAFAVLKATYILSSNPVPAENQLPVAMADEYHGDPGASSIQSAGDFAMRKPATDVLLQGMAYSPGGRRASYVDVTLAVSERISKTIRVSGDRSWQGSGAMAAASAPQPFERMPLTWERAAGGRDVTGNPVGCTSQCPPNLEDLRDRNAPAGFGPLAAHWEPRRSCAGTYDDHWVRNRAPYLPSDFNPWFYQLAPRDQCVQGYLQGGEPFHLAGCVPMGQLSFTLPRHQVSFAFRLDKREGLLGAVLDTVTIDTAAMLLKVVWRSSLSCDKKALRIREVEVLLG